MNITERSPHRITVEADGRTFTGLNSGVPSSGLAAQRMGVLSRQNATLVIAGRFHPWPIERIVQHRGTFFLCGPVLEGLTLAERLADAPVNDAAWLCDYLSAVAAAAAYPDLATTHLGATMLTREGALLMFPRELVEQMDANLPLPDRRQNLFPYRAPRLRPPEGELYGGAAVAYHALSGEPLCRVQEQHGAERCHASSLEKAPIHLHRPGLDPVLAAMVDAALARGEARSIEAITRLSEQLRASPVEDGAPEGTVAERKRVAEEKIERRRSSSQRRTFLRNHGTKLLIAAAIAVVVLWIPARMISDRLQPPVTAGMEPRTVAQLYYHAWNDLDHILMEDLLYRRTGVDRVREVTNVYVVDRVQTARSWESRLMPADDWRAAGAPGDRLPYGVADLELRLVSQGAETAVVTASFSRWRPHAVEDDTGTSQPVAIRADVRDTLHLQRDREGWIIREIVSTESDETLVPLSPVPED